VSAARVVAIDGGAGSGKSTLARGLARRLRLPYVNTGEMYRALAATALREGVDVDDGGALLGLARDLRFSLTAGDDPQLEVEGWARHDLHTAAVDSTVSAVARHPSVRAHLRDVQRALADHGAVVEGRDIASVVVPEAAVKIYVTAATDVRADRRAAERGRGVSTEDVGDALQRRDTLDAVTNPLAPAVGADVIDTTDLDVDAALEAAIGIVRRRAPQLLA
jgi:cytidylate kinase